MSFRARVSLVVALCLAAPAAHASSIGVFFTPDGSDCDGVIQPFMPVNLYVVAILGGDAAENGIQGAEYRITGFDPTWFATFVPPPLICDPGPCNSPFDPTGTSTGFASCQTTGTVLLGTINVLAIGPTAERTLHVEGRNPPSDPEFACPVVRLCDAPVFTMLCVAGGEAFVNRSIPCTVGVATETWTGVKGLYH